MRNACIVCWLGDHGSAAWPPSSQRPPGGRVRVTDGVRYGSLPRALHQPAVSGPSEKRGPRVSRSMSVRPRLYLCLPCVHRHVCVCVCVCTPAPHVRPCPHRQPLEATGALSRGAERSRESPAELTLCPDPWGWGESQPKGRTWTPQPPAGGRKGPRLGFRRVQAAGRRPPAHLGAPISSLQVLSNTKQW